MRAARQPRQTWGVRAKIGVVGALLGGYLATDILGIADPISALDLTAIIVAFIGAVIVIGTVRVLSSGPVTI